MGILSKTERVEWRRISGRSAGHARWTDSEMGDALDTCDALEVERDALKKLEHIQAAGLLDHENVLLGDRCAKLEAERGALTRAKEALSDTLSETLARSEGLRKERDALLDWRRGFVERAQEYMNTDGPGSAERLAGLVRDLAAVDIEPKPTEAERTSFGGSR